MLSAIIWSPNSPSASVSDFKNISVKAGNDFWISSINNESFCAIFIAIERLESLESHFIVLVGLQSLYINIKITFYVDFVIMLYISTISGF